MSTATHQLHAVEQHPVDLGLAADETGRTPTPSRPTRVGTIELSRGAPEDREVVRQLAELDDACELADPVLLALRDGHAVAALSLRDRRVVANPFVPTRDAVALLRVWAEHGSGSRPRRRFFEKLRLT